MKQLLVYIVLFATLVSALKIDKSALLSISDVSYDAMYENRNKRIVIPEIPTASPNCVFRNSCRDDPEVIGQCMNPSNITTFPEVSEGCNDCDPCTLDLCLFCDGDMDGNFNCECAFIPIPNCQCIPSNNCTGGDGFCSVEGDPSNIHGGCSDCDACTDDYCLFCDPDKDGQYGCECTHVPNNNPGCVCIPKNNCTGGDGFCSDPHSNQTHTGCDDCDSCTLDYCLFCDPEDGIDNNFQCGCEFVEIPGCRSQTTGTTGISQTTAISTGLTTGDSCVISNVCTGGNGTCSANSGCNDCDPCTHDWCLYCDLDKNGVYQCECNHPPKYTPECLNQTTGIGVIPNSTTGILLLAHTSTSVVVKSSNSDDVDTAIVAVGIGILFILIMFGFWIWYSWYYSEPNNVVYTSPPPPQPNTVVITHTGGASTQMNQSSTPPPPPIQQYQFTNSNSYMQQQQQTSMSHNMPSNFQYINEQTNIKTTSTSRYNKNSTNTFVDEVDE